jgi:hypothetical protein
VWDRGGATVVAHSGRAVGVERTGGDDQSGELEVEAHAVERAGGDL